MTNVEALTRIKELNAEREMRLREVEAAEAVPTPTLDAMMRIRKLMTSLQGELCDLGIPHRMELTLRDITNLMNRVEV